MSPEWEFGDFQQDFQQLELFGALLLFGCIYSNMRTVITLLVLFSFSQAFTFRYTKRSAVISRFNGDIATIKNAKRGSKFSFFQPKLYASNVENDDADETKGGEDKEEEDDTQNRYNRDNRETQTVCLRPLSINLPLLRYIYFL